MLNDFFPFAHTGFLIREVICACVCVINFNIFFCVTYSLQMGYGVYVTILIQFVVFSVEKIHYFHFMSYNQYFIA